MSILSAQIDALLENETNQTANLANASALLNDTLKDINWVGFYLYDETADQLDLGPFKVKLLVCISKTELVFVVLPFEPVKSYASPMSMNL